MAAAVETRGAAFEVGVVRSLFEVRPQLGLCGYLCAVTPDGKRFLVNTALEPAAQAPMTVVLNWPALLKENSR